MADRALITGCGRIAGEYNPKGSPYLLTHAAAYVAEQIEIAGCHDLNPDRAEQFAARWNIGSHGSDLKMLLDTCQPQIVSICTPPENRMTILQEICSFHSIHTVIIEKPLAASYNESKEIAALFRESGKTALVNYTRAFDPFYLELEATIARKEFGPLKGGTACYYGTLSNIATHWMERVIAISGPILSVEVLTKSTESPAFILQCKDCAYHFVPAPRVSYLPFELDLFFESHRLRIVDSERRAEYFCATDDLLFRGVKTLSVSPQKKSTKPDHEAIAYVIRHALAGNARGTLDRAVEVQRLVELVGLSS